MANKAKIEESIDNTKVEESAPAPDLGTPDFSQFSEVEEITPDMLETEKKQTNKKALGVGEAIAMFANLSFGFVASRKGEHWRLSPEETAELAGATEDCINEHFPDFEISPTWTLVGVSAAIVAPRLLIDKQLELEQAKREKSASDEVKEKTEQGADNES